MTISTSACPRSPERCRRQTRLPIVTSRPLRTLSCRSMPKVSDGSRISRGDRLFAYRSHLRPSLKVRPVPARRGGAGPARGTFPGLCGGASEKRLARRQLVLDDRGDRAEDRAELVREERDRHEEGERDEGDEDDVLDEALTLFAPLERGSRLDGVGH